MMGIYSVAALNDDGPSLEARRTCWQKEAKGRLTRRILFPLISTNFRVLLATLVATTAFGQVSLIGPSTLNGSFESGIASPWNGVEVTNNAAFASAGNWCAVLHDANSPTARDLCFQFLSASPSGGLTFIATFDARNGTTGFDSVAAFFFARNTDGTFVNATATPVLAPPLDASAWGHYETDFQLPGTWDGVGNISLQIQFTKNGAAGGTTYFGYLDAITLQQVPEPSSAILLVLGGFLAARGFCGVGRRPKPTSVS
jgi:hypothetical protein